MCMQSHQRLKQLMVLHEHVITRKHPSRIPVWSANNLSHVGSHIRQFVPWLAGLPCGLLHHEIRTFWIRPPVHRVGVVYDTGGCHDCWNRYTHAYDLKYVNKWTIYFVSSLFRPIYCVVRNNNGGSL